MKKVTLIGSIMAFSPLLAFAQVNTNLGFFSNLVNQLSDLIGLAVPVVIALAVLLFLWGLVSYIMNQDDAEKRAGARSRMIWGVVIIFVMVAVWGLVVLLAQVTGVSTSEGALTPAVPAP